MISRSPTLAEVLNAMKASMYAGLRVALPGRVESYDPSTQRADVQPLIHDRIEQQDGQLAALRLPVVTSVPVCFPAGGGMRITFPLAIGDTVLLVFGDRSFDAWLTQGGETNPPDFLRRHDLSDAVAIPGLHPGTAALPDVDPAVITIGSNDGARDFAATAQRVLTEIQKVKGAFDGHTHAAGTLAAPNGAVVGVTAGAANSPALSAPASATVVVKG